MNGTYSFALNGYKPITGPISLQAQRPAYLAYVLKNYERTGVSRPTQNSAPLSTLGLPDTVKTVQPTWVSLTEKLQRFWYNLLKSYGPSTWTESQYKNAWHSLTHGARAFTNKRGWNNGYRDFIWGINETAEPMMFEPIVTGGNVVSLVSPEKVSIGGAMCYQIYTLDPVENPSNYELSPWFVYEATISRREGYNAETQKWAREDLEICFPQLAGRPVPIPLFSKGGRNYIVASRVRILGESEPIPPIYNL